MSVALETNTSNRPIDPPSGFVHGMSCIPIFDSSESTTFGAGDQRLFPATVERDNVLLCSESSSSSIGKNSDDLSAGDGEAGDGDEVQSKYKGSFEGMDVLEEVLPAKRGISSFYHGKSKSFTSLKEAASSSSIEDIVKPENAYSRRRRNLLTYTNFFDKTRNHLSKSNNGGISKRQLHASRSTLALAVTMCSEGATTSTHHSLPPLPPHGRRPLPHNDSLPPSPLRRNFSTWRSFSLFDLQCAAAAPAIASSAINNVENDKLH